MTVSPEVPCLATHCICQPQIKRMTARQTTIVIVTAVASVGLQRRPAAQLEEEEEGQPIRKRGTALVSLTMCR